MRTSISTRVPAWVLALAAMPTVQLANALSVGVIAHVGSAGTAWLRMCCGAVLLWVIARPSLRSLRARDLPAVLLWAPRPGS
ncbi:hypothetical protein [Microbacterium sp. NPDC096154]|uniref:hypothetical protein n=1 Tax=Microbacterium sp. NPDC096154 TaxID=3155549 RepID=UPI00332A0FD2